MAVTIDHPQDWAVYVSSEVTGRSPLEIRGRRNCDEVSILVGRISDGGVSFRISVDDLLKAAEHVRALSNHKATR